VRIDIGGLAERFRGGVDALLAGNDLSAMPSVATEDAARAWVAAGVPAEIARHVAALDALVAVPDIVALSEVRRVPVPQAARVHHLAGERFGFRWAREAAPRLPVRSQWQKLAIAALIEDFSGQQRDVAGGILAKMAETPESPAEDALSAFVAANAFAVGQADRLLAEYREATGTPDLAMLTVAARQLRALARS
jgi:glutamate dehydrogenase